MRRESFSVVRRGPEWAVCVHGEPVLSLQRRKNAVALAAKVAASGADMRVPTPPAVRGAASEAQA